MRLDSYTSGVLFVVLSMAASVVALVLVRRRINPEGLKACHEVGGYLLSVVGTCYAVLLGLIVVDAMSVFQEAHQTNQAEANAAADIVLLARSLPPERRALFDRLTVAYVDVLIEQEWDVLDDGRIAPEARRALLDLIDAVFADRPEGEAEQSLHDAQVQAAVQLWNSRRCRTELAGQGIPALKWFVLICGGLVTVFFTFFFVVEDLRVQAVMTSLIALIIALNIYLVLMFGYPYSGDLRVSPECFRVVKEIADDHRYRHVETVDAAP